MRSAIGLVLLLAVTQAEAQSHSPPWRTMGPAAVPPTPVRFQPAELVLGDQAVGGKSEIQKVTVRNSGSGRARLGNWSVVGDASIETDCGRELAPGEQCELRLRFVPTTAGLRRATVIVMDESHGSLLSLGVSGRGVLPVEHALAAGGANARRRAALPRARRPRQRF